MLWHFLFLLFKFVLSNSSEAPTYHELYRPGYHFSPPKNWLNDPNGLIYFGNVYHLYYQYNPFGTDWGHMSWGHAISRDLVHWTNLPVAIPEYDDVMIFSGCNIIDKNNTSGFCTSKELGCLLAFYTQQTNRESQAIAYSNDFGLTYKQYAYNPIIDLNEKDFRDPKVFWYEQEEKWVMVVALSVVFKLQFYSSKDLVNWTLLSEFGPDGSTVGPWEDPDLFALPDEEGNLRWVLYHAVDNEYVEYYIGDFDGKTFVNSETKGETLLIDYGKDFIEAATWNNEPKGRRLIIAYFADGGYAPGLPTQVWRGQLTLIRELKLKRYQEGLRIIQQPIEELSSLRYSPEHYGKMQLNSTSLNFANASQIEIVAEFSVPAENSAKEFGFKVFVGENQSTTIAYRVDLQDLSVDRRNSGLVNFSSYFPTVTNHTLSLENGRIKLRIFIDQSSVEVFANDGKLAMTNLVYPDPLKNQIIVYATDGSVVMESMDTWLLQDIWSSSLENDKETLDVFWKNMRRKEEFISS